VISYCGSFRVLFDKIVSVYFTWKLYLYFCIGNGQPIEPALCQLYRHTFVPYHNCAFFGWVPIQSRAFELDAFERESFSLYTSCVFLFFSFYAFCICAPVLYHLVVKAASIDSIRASLAACCFFLNACAVVCVLRRINTVSQSGNGGGIYLVTFPGSQFD